MHLAVLSGQMAAWRLAIIIYYFRLDCHGSADKNKIFSVQPTTKSGCQLLFRGLST